MWSEDLKKYKILMRPLLREMIYSGNSFVPKNTTRRKRLWTRSDVTPEGQRKFSTNVFPMIAVLLYFALMSVTLGLALTESLKLIGRVDLYLSFVSSIIPIVVIVFGALQAVVVLYHDAGLEPLLVLPVKPSVVIASKLTQAFLPTAAYIFALTFPGLVAHGIAAGRPWLFYLQSLLYAPLSMIAPYAVMVTLLLVLMRYTKFARNKDRFQMLSSVLSIALFLSFVLFTSLTPKDTSGHYTIFQESGVTDFIHAVDTYIPSARLGTAMLSTAASWSTLLYGAGLLLLDALLFVLLFSVANRLYIPGVLGVKGGAKRRTKGEASLSFREKSPWRAIVGKEWRLLFRTPAFFTQLLLPQILIPVMLMVMFLLLTKSDLGMESSPVDFMRNLFLSGAWLRHLWIIALVASGLASFFSGANNFSATAVSRQGKSFYYTKTMPVPAGTQMLAWMTPGLTTMVIDWALITIALSLILRPPFLFWLIVFALGLVNGLLFQLVTLFVDLKKPLLDWETEMQAVKTSKSVMISAIGMFLHILVLVGLAFLARAITSGNNAVTTAVIVLVPLVADIVFGVKLFGNADRLLEAIDA